jgi:hypothetical protein
MAWVEGYNRTTSLIDWNKKFMDELRGDLDEEEAQKTLGKFLMHNPGFFSFMLTGFKLEPYQRLILKGWFNSNFSLMVAGRGFGKTFLAAHFCILYALINPDNHILIVSGANFRSSRSTLEMIDKWSRKCDPNSGNPYMLGATIVGEMTKKQDLYRITFSNNSTITAIPLGAGDNNNNLRGFRCNVLIIDEALLISPKVVELILKPFLIASADITYKQTIREKEDRLIKAGKMKEEERFNFKSSSKLIRISSASYQWEHLYDTYKQFLKIIYGLEGRPEGTDPDSRYLIQQCSYKIMREEMIDKSILNELRSGEIPANVIKREYEAQFVLESGGYFDAEKMVKCTVPDGEKPHLEITGEPGAEYVLAIDPSISSDVAGDHFAMCVLKLVDKQNKEGRILKQIGMVVHQYAYTGCSVAYHMEYLLYILKNFNIVYIVLDATQGDSGDFISMCNESELFKSRNINLGAINADFNGVDFDTMVKEAKGNYSKQEKRIVQKQYFSGSFIKASNENLKQCFDFENMRFASKILSVDGAAAKLSGLSVGIYRQHPCFAEKTKDQVVDGSLYDFLQHQDTLVDLTKKECSFITPTVTPLGHVSFDLPANLKKRTKDPKRNRKDSYSALLMGLWGVKIYTSMKELPDVEEEEDLPPPMLVGRGQVMGYR